MRFLPVYAGNRSSTLNNKVMIPTPKPVNKTAPMLNPAMNRFRASFRADSLSSRASFRAHSLSSRASFLAASLDSRASCRAESIACITSRRNDSFARRRASWREIMSAKRWRLASCTASTRVMRFFRRNHLRSLRPAVLLPRRRGRRRVLDAPGEHAAGQGGQRIQVPMARWLVYGALGARLGHQGYGVAIDQEGLTVDV